MVVAVVAVRMMQVILNHVIDVISMRNLRMPAVWTVGVVAAVRATLMLWSTPRRVRRTDRDYMLVDVVVVEMVQMSIVQIIDVVPVLDGHMAATRAMAVAVSFVHLAGRLSHRASFNATGPWTSIPPATLGGNHTARRVR